MRIGFIGYGEAGRAFCRSLAAVGNGIDFSAWDILCDDPATGTAMRARITGDGAEALSGPGGLAGADWVISAVTADQSMKAIEALVPHLRQGQLVIDINSVSPGRKEASAALVEGAGARYLDMAVMAPVLPRGHKTPVLVAGACAQALVPELKAMGFGFSVAGEAAGKATAIKMVRSVFVKGLEAITVEALLAARASGCLDEVYESLSSSYPGLGWPEIATYHFERVMTHGKRRAAEMMESGATLDALGLNGNLAREIAAVDAAMGGLPADAPRADALAETLGAVLKARRARKA
jgi:3-hydroxyisobutyrate dehydrogenase-like beta-hydroxyacid dehydrogenase